MKDPLLIYAVLVLLCTRVRGYNNVDWKFTSQPYTTTGARQTLTPTPGGNTDNVEVSSCPLPGSCDDRTPVCGSDCQIYPDSCYMRYIGCLQNQTIASVSLSYCTEQRSLHLLTLPKTVNALYGQNVVLECRMREDSGIPVKVVWFEVTTKGPIEIQSGRADDTALNVTIMEEEAEGRYFFCQISNCQGTIVQSNTVKVAIPENICLIYGAGHVHTFTQGSYSYQTDCTHVAAMDTRHRNWFVYVRYQETWQISPPTLSTVTIYYNQIPLEIQRGWVINYFGNKVTVREGESREIFDMTITFDGLYMRVRTPEVTVHWDGLGSVIIGVPLDAQTLGLCGSNRRGEPLRSRFRRRRSYLQETNEPSTTSVSSFVKSWALGRSCIYEEDIISGRNIPVSSEICGAVDVRNVPASMRTFYRDGCDKDRKLRELMSGSVPTYCFTQLAVYHLLDKLSNTINTDIRPVDTEPVDGAVCELSVLRRQYLAFYSGCPSPNPPFDVT